jgi:NAD(P)-dependent dehydrogenase (short-subunit alcohol dehydrogenase family)
MERPAEAALPGKIIVTGARGLIGQSLVSQFRARGVEVLELDLATGHDLTDETFVREWFAANRAPALVNAFALNDHVETPRKSNRLLDISLESFDRFLQINLRSLFSVCREYARNNDAGSIVNFTSVYGIVSPIPELYGDDEKHIGYGVSKAGVIQLSRHLAVHLAPKIRVNTVAPGGVVHRQSREFQAAYGAQTPLGRMMSVDEAYGVVEFLVSSKSSYCTGGLFTIDGGWTAW